MAAATSRPDRFVGLHFFNPVPLMPLVEVVRTFTTSPETFDRAFAFAAALGKEPVAAVDSPGSSSTCCWFPFCWTRPGRWSGASASTADIDRAMQLGCGHPMGPLSLLDFIGLDTAVRIADIMFEAYRDTRYAPPAAASADGRGRAPWPEKRAGVL